MKRPLTHQLLVLICIFFSSCFKENKRKDDVANAPVKNALIAKGNTLWDNGKTDEAFLVFNQARELSAKDKDSFNLAIALGSMGIIATESGDSFDGQEYSFEALKYLQINQKRDHPYLVSNFNNLGIASYDLKKYADAIDFYTQAIPLITDSSYMHITKNNLANAYRESVKYPMAIRLYNQVLSARPSDANKARTLTNQAKTQFLSNSHFIPVPMYLEALKIRRQTQDLWGQNSSYSHLSDYYLRVKPDSALFYSKLMYRLALALNNPDNELEALAKLAELEPLKRLFYFKRYRQLDDSLTGIRNASKNQFALIRYQTEKHKSEKLRLEKENEQKKLQIARRNIWLSIAVFAIILTLLTSVAVYRQRKKRIAHQAQEQIKENKLKTSKEIHDVVANGLYRMMSEVEYSPTIDKQGLISQIEILYNQSRRISHSVSASPMDFIERLNELIRSFSNPETKILTVGLEEKLNSCLNAQIKEEVLLIIQELLVNMDKHSKAAQVVLRFEILQNQLEIRYRDNGKGLSKDNNAGKGLLNTESRITALKGVFTFGNHSSSGLEAQIQIPLT
ncbi:tetratricopeptide repeat-containing sensor histidine kinase [Pedobacter sp. Leaf170]|uniref:tetratricopeptide repeat-containing sensor histidine kinase n=1 Tax=Pedobacter sp. Leaf170 TaxID=2876558 RepID=UPI001E43E899|nr:tetratricopeptide repeat-containing sensor histidine kinase [Pedobacter sp. Leaf170]